MENNKIVLGDCLDLMSNVKDESVDLIYMDPSVLYSDSPKTF